MNHLLFSEGWVPERLRAFFGQSVRIEIGAFGFPLRVTSEVARQQDVSVFCSEVGKAQEELARLEKRVAQLEG